jgi:uncharacterized protein (DUF1015 family)
VRRFNTGKQYPLKRYRQIKSTKISSTEKILSQRQKNQLYIHKIITKHLFTGIIVGTSIDDYHNNKIKKHEKLLLLECSYFKDYMKFSEFNSEPVLMTYPDNKTLENWI